MHFSPVFRSLFGCGNLISGVPLRRGNGHKGGEVKVQSPRLGGLWWSAWELEKRKLWLEYEWNHGRGGEERGKKRGEEKGGLWLNYSPHHGQQRRTFSTSAQAWSPLLLLTDGHRADTWEQVWDREAATWDTVHRAIVCWSRSVHPFRLMWEERSCWDEWKVKRNLEIHFFFKEEKRNPASA